MKSSFKNSLLITVISSVLAACGGGGGSTPNTNTPPAPVQTASISGKAIDGYLVGAKVCIDLNDSGACDATEPSTTTDDNGNYKIPLTSDVTGKKLLVEVSTTTKDLSRPGYTFPSAFTMSSVITTADVQHVSPLTTMVTAQMNIGKSYTEATAAVSAAVGTSVNTSADYILSKDVFLSDKAAKLVDKVTSLAANSKADSKTTQAVLNAVIAKGDIASVTQDDVDVQIMKLNASSISASPLTGLANPLYAFNGSFIDATGAKRLTRDQWQAANGVLTRVAQKWDGASWVDRSPTDSPKGVNGMFYLKADGTWSAPIAPSAQTKWTIQNVTAGGEITAVDEVGYASTFSMFMQSYDAKPFKDAMNGYVDYTVSDKLTGLFDAGTIGFKLVGRRTQDAIALPTYGNCGSKPTIADSGINHCNYLGEATTTYTSVDQVIGLNITDDSGLIVKLSQFGQGQILNADGSVAAAGGAITWSKYNGSNDVIVVNASIGACTTLALCKDLPEGNKFVVALHNGHLMRGSLEHLQNQANGIALQTSSFGKMYAELKGLLGF